MTFREALVGLAACVVRVRSSEGALYIQTPVGAVAFIQPLSCPETTWSDGASRYCMSGWHVPVESCVRVGDLHVCAWRPE